MCCLRHVLKFGCIKKHGSSLNIQSHYSKSQIFVQKINFDKTFSRVFLSKIFLVKSKLSTAKKSKTTTFSRVFHPKKIDNFLGKSKSNFWTKNEDFEQCVNADSSVVNSKGQADSMLTVSLLFVTKVHHLR